jgi:DNA repair protein RecN (Recombination protein N)
MLRRLCLQDFVIVNRLEVELSSGFSVLTGETGAGKSILIDALQLALGSRGDAGVVREGAARADIVAEFDVPSSLSGWLEEGGFKLVDSAQDSILLRRSIDTQGKSRAWINGSAATIAQLREAADHLVDIHGQHAWQSLTRGPAVRGLLDAFAGVDSTPLAACWTHWKQATEALNVAKTQQIDLGRESERLAWQIGELDKLAPGADEWSELEAEHKRLANAQSLMGAARTALNAISDADDNADALTSRALNALQDVAAFDSGLAAAIDVLHSAQAQLQDAAHTLNSYLSHTDLEPQRLQALDERLSAWVSLARRYRRPPAELPVLLSQWRAELQALEEAADLDGLQQAVLQALAAFNKQAKQVSAARHTAAFKLAQAVTSAMQQLGMAGGQFEVALTAQDTPQSFGLESAEFLVAGHAGSTPRPLGKVASGGELSRIALAIAVTTSQLHSVQNASDTASALIFDEIDSGVGGAVAETVGRLMKQLGSTLGCERQVLAVTHLPQVAACADHHFVVSKQLQAGLTLSDVRVVNGEARMAEIARMLGGERLSNTSLAHAQEMLTVGANVAQAPLPQPKEFTPTQRGRKKS